MDEYQRTRDAVRRRTIESFMENMSDDELLRAVERMDNDPEVSYGYIKHLSQERVAKLFPLIADGSWRLKDSYCCHEDSLNDIRAYSKGDGNHPLFLDVESYKAFRELRKKFPKGFDFYPNARKEYEEYNKKHPDFWGDARMYDGRAEFRFGSVRFAPNKVSRECGQVKYEDTDWIQPDELFLVLDIQADSNTQQEYAKGTPGLCFVLTPNCETVEERKLKLYKYFKHHIVSRYVDMLMKEYDKIDIRQWSDDLVRLHVSLDERQEEPKLVLDDNFGLKPGEAIQ